jgi:hypothetical protein
MSTDLPLCGLPADGPRSIPWDNPHNPIANAHPRPEHGGSLGGTTGYRSLEEANVRSARTGCNNPADGSKFFGPGADADDPRAPSRHVAQRHFQLPRTSADSVPGNAVPAPVDKHAPARRPDTSLALVAGTTPAPWLGIRDCSNTSAHNRAEKNIHNPPAGTGEDAVGRADLEIPFRMTYCEEGPREVLLPTGQVSDGSSLLPPEAILCFLPDSDLVSLPTSLYLNSSLATRHPSRPIAIRAAHIHDHQPPVISLNHPDQTGRILLATDILAKESDRADYSMGLGPFGVAVIELDDQIIRLEHCSGNQLTHVPPPANKPANNL